MRNLRVVGYQRGIRKSSRETMKVQASIGVATFLNSECETPRSADDHRFRKDGLGGMFVFSKYGVRTSGLQFSRMLCTTKR